MLLAERRRCEDKTKEGGFKLLPTTRLKNIQLCEARFS